jgi:hypothetical protein
VTMLPRSMPMTLSSTLRRLLTDARASKFRKVPSSTSLFVRAFSHRTIGSRLLKPSTGSQATSVITPNAPAVNNVVFRSYATTTRKPTAKKTTKKTTKRKTAAKKKKPVKKVAKKRQVKKAEKPKRPKLTKLPSGRGISGYTLFVSENLNSQTGQDAISRMKSVSASWKALSDSEKAVFPMQSPLILGLQQ